MSFCKEERTRKFMPIWVEVRWDTKMVLHGEALCFWWRGEHQFNGKMPFPASDCCSGQGTGSRQETKEQVWPWGRKVLDVCICPSLKEEKRFHFLHSHEPKFKTMGKIVQKRHNWF
jgi:hypothetical protein